MMQIYLYNSEQLLVYRSPAGQARMQGGFKGSTIPTFEKKGGQEYLFGRTNLKICWTVQYIPW